MPRQSASTRVEMASDVHERILSAAIKLFSASSLSGVTIQMLCKHAHCTPHEYYKLFDTMDELYVEAIDTVVTRTNTGFDSLVSAMHSNHPGPARSIERIAMWIEDLSQLDASFLMQVYLTDLKAPRTAVAAFFDRLIAALEDALKEKKTPKPSEEAKDLVRLLFWSKVLEAPSDKEEMRKTFKRWLGRLHS